MAARLHKKKSTSQSVEKPALSAICVANVGANTVAAAHAIMYKDAYSPRLFSLLRFTQKLLRKGKRNISPNVTVIILATTTVAEWPQINTRNDKAIIAAPVITYSNVLALFSSL